MSTIRQRLLTIAERVDHLNFLIERGRVKNPKELDRLKRERRALQWALCELVGQVDDASLRARAERFAAERVARKLAACQTSTPNGASPISPTGDPR
jgi:hypothetical protein